MGMQKSRKKASSNRPALSAERIAECAIAMADEEGLEKLSMRRLADRLDVEAMSLYHHLPSKAALLEAMADRLGDALPLASGGSWLECLRASAYGWRDLALAHPGAFALLATRASAGASLLERGATLVARLREGGFSAPASARALSSYFCSLNGFLLAAGVPTVFRNVPEAGVEGSTLTSTAAALRDVPVNAWVLTSDAAFDFHVTMLLDGLQAALEREGVGNTPAGRPG